ncbi:MAG: substrate-binding domain-containing protein, partial [Verrucomicrobiota bacterium]
MKVAIHSEFAGAGQMAFYSGLDAGNRTHGANISFLPLREPLESIWGSSRLLDMADACVGSLVSDAWFERLGDRRIRCVNLGQWSRICSVATVGLDYYQAGFDAAEALIETAAREIYVVGPAGQWRTRRLFEGAEASAAGLEGVSILRGPSIYGNALSSWLARFTKDETVGIVAISDFVARRIIDLAIEEGLEPGSFLRIVGIGDDPEASLLSPISIASVQIPYHAMGRKVVDCLLSEAGDSEDEEPVSHLLRPGPLMERESLGRSAKRDPTVERALVLMKRLIRRPFGIDSLAQRLGVSRRSLEVKFRTANLDSPSKAWL